MTGVNLIPAHYRQARQRRRRARAWFSVCGGYAIVLAVAYLGAASALGDGGSAAGDLGKTQQQVEELTRASAMLKLQLRDALIKLNIARAVGDQPDWSLLLGLLAKLTDEKIVLRSCHLETASESRQVATGTTGKPATQPTVPEPKDAVFNLTLVGFAKTQNDVTQFALRLEKLGLFDQVDLLQSAREPIGTTQATAFRVQCALHNRGSVEK
jgi:hypothetical protein